MVFKYTILFDAYTVTETVFKYTILFDAYLLLIYLFLSLPEKAKDYIFRLSWMCFLYTINY